MLEHRLARRRIRGHGFLITNLRAARCAFDADITKDRPVRTVKILRTPMTKTAISVQLDAAEAFVSAVQARSCKMGMIGLGYVGLPLALLYVEQDFPVVGFDVDGEKVRKLNSGSSYIHRIAADQIRGARN